MFNWQDLAFRRFGLSRADEFREWVLPEITSSAGAILDQRLDIATKHYTEVEMTVSINGITIPGGDKFLTDLYDQFQNMVDRRALEIVDEKFADTIQALTETRDRFKTDEEYWSEALDSNGVGD